MTDRTPVEKSGDTDSDRTTSEYLADHALPPEPVGSGGSGGSDGPDGAHGVPSHEN